MDGDSAYHQLLREERHKLQNNFSPGSYMDSHSDQVSAFASKKLPQFLAAGVATLGALGLGTVLGYTSPALPDIKNSTMFSHLEESDHSWIGSIAPIGACVSGPVAGFLVDTFGRKKCMLFVAPLFILGWLLIAFAEYVEMIFAGRFITGFCGGTFSLAAPVYISETAESSIRGTLGSSLQLMINCGVLTTYVIGYFLEWNWLALVCASIPAGFFVAMIFMPESPRYLMSKKDKVGASNALKWLRGASQHQQVKDELNALQASIEECEVPKFRAMFTGSILKPLGISLALMFFQQWNGNNAIVFYTVDIFNDAGSTLDPKIATIIVGAVQVVASIVAAILMDKAGRRVLLLLSGALMTAALSVLGGFFYMKEEDPSVKDYLGWLPLLCLMVFIVAFSLGFGPIAWLLAGEILPPNVKGRASALATSFNWLNTFVVTKVFDNIKIGLGIEWCFWIFGIAAFLGDIFVILFVPETKGKSLDEIQMHFKGNTENHVGVGHGGNVEQF
ncbi:Facilitated trehalose transporter Tret1-2 [Orchesella cincta]|uniref:Facilitated trehalose transporter Tret1-2 n=1 Tax=Orchesella cincta TaxID=48709 RepID=A0A1D2NCV2_ORCCI|nr:Facilitated trehalose transporter Tret1-2 [Orchesella cincta]